MSTPIIRTHLSPKTFPFGVFLNDQSLSNILSFAAVVSKFRITTNTELYPSINVHLHNGKRIIFKKFGGGIYYFGATNEAFDKDQNTYYIFLNTVDSNNPLFKIRDIKGSDEERIIH